MTHAYTRCIAAHRRSGGGARPLRCPPPPGPHKSFHRRPRTIRQCRLHSRGAHGRDVRALLLLFRSWLVKKEKKKKSRRENLENDKRFYELRRFGTGEKKKQ